MDSGRKNSRKITMEKPATSYVSKVTHMKRLERAKMDSMINRLRAEPEEVEEHTEKNFFGYDQSRESTTMTGLPWKVRDRLEGKLPEKSSSEILAGRPQLANYVFTYGTESDHDEDESTEGEIKKTSGKTVKINPMPTNVAGTSSKNKTENDIYYRDWAHFDKKYVEDSQNLINKTQNILEKAGLTRNSHDADMVTYLEALENMDRKQFDPTVLEAQELKDQEEGIQAFSGSSAKKSTSRIQPPVYYTKSPGSSRLSIGPSKSKKIVRIHDPSEPPVSTFLPTYKLGGIDKEKTIDRHLQNDQKINSSGTDRHSFQEYAKRKRELMEAALQAYDPDSPTYEVLPDINDSNFQDDSDHLEATTEALTLLYGAIANQNKLNKPTEDEPKTTLHVSKLPAQSDAEILENSVFRPLDHFKGSVIGSVLREIKETEENKPPRQFSGTFVPIRPSPQFASHPTRKSKEKLEAIRIIENYRLSKSREKKRFPGITIAPNTFNKDDDNEPSFLIVNKVSTTPTPTSTTRPGRGIIKNPNKNSTKLSSPGVRVQHGSTITGTPTMYNMPGTKKYVETMKGESLSSLKPTRGSEIDYNLRTKVPKNPTVGPSVDRVRRAGKTETQKTITNNAKHGKGSNPSGEPGTVQNGGKKMQFGQNQSKK